jgi:hypothetical protein
MPKTVPLYGLGAEAPPTFGQTSDDIKLGLFAGATASGVNTFNEMFGPTLMRKTERQQLAPNEEKEARRQTAQYQPTSEFEEALLSSFNQSNVPQDVGRTYSAEEATNYNKDLGLSYNTPQSKAQLEWDRENQIQRMRRQNQVARIQDGFIPKAFGFAGGFVGAMADPTNLVLIALPSSAQIRAAKAAVSAGKGMKATQAVLKTGVLAEMPSLAPAIASARAKDFGIAFIEGLTVDAMVEVPNYFISNQLQEEYAMESLIFSTLAGGVFSGVIQGGLSGVTRRTINDGLQRDYVNLVKTHMKLEETLRGEGIGLYNGLALLDAEARIEVRAAVAKAIREGAELGEALEDAGFRPDGSFHSTVVPLTGVEPPQVGRTGVPGGGVGQRSARAKFMKRMQAGLDHDLYFGEMVNGASFKDDVLRFAREKKKAKKKALREDQPKGKQKKDTRSAKQKQYEKMRDRYLDPEEFEEMAEGMLEGGLWRVQDLDELEGNPYAKPRIEDADDVFEISKQLDELADATGMLELKALDRSKHIMKSVEMRIKATRVALADMLAGREVNTDFLVREGVLFDLKNRGRISEAEFGEQMKQLANDYKLDLEAVDNYGIFRNKVDAVSEEQFNKQVKDLSAKDIDDEATAMARFLEDDVVENIPEELLDSPQFQKAERAYSETNETSKLLKGEDVEKGIEGLAKCMAKIGTD